MSNDKETTAIAKYGDWTPEQMDKESTEMSSGGDFWKVPVGRTTVRFLPPKLGWPSPFVIQHQHFIDLPGVENSIVFACPRLHEKKKCLACEKADKLETSGNARDSKAARKLRPGKRVMANVVINPKDPMSVVSIWGFGKTVYEMLKAIRQDDENGGNFLDPMKGFNIGVTRVGTGKDDTKYTLMPAREQTKLHNMEWLEIQKDLRPLVRIPTVEQQKRLFDGDDPRDVWGEGDQARRDEADGRPKRVKPAGDVIDVDPGASTPTAEDDLFDDEADLD
jgi:hypothetical protein